MLAVTGCCWCCLLHDMTFPALPKQRGGPWCRLGHHPGQLLSRLAQQLEPNVHGLDTKQLTLVAWSLAKLGIIGEHEGALLDAIAVAGIQQAEQFTSLVRHTCGGTCCSAC